MAVKTLPQAGDVVEQTTRTRVIPSAQAPPLGSQPWKGMEPFDYVNSLTADDWMNHKQEVRIYQVDGSQRKLILEKWLATRRPPADLDEYWVKQKYRGGNFFLMVHRDGQVIIGDAFSIPGEFQAPSGDSDAGSGSSSSEMGQIVLMMRDEMRNLREELRQMRGGDVTADALRNAVALSGKVFDSAANAAVGSLERLGNHGGASNDPRLALLDKFMDVMLAKLLNPTDPIETFSKMLVAVNTIPGLKGGKATMAAEIAQYIPTVTKALTDVAQQWRLGSEAQERTVAMQRGTAPATFTNPPQRANGGPAPGGPPDNLVVMPPPQPAGAAAPPAGPPPAGSIQMSLETLEVMIVQIITDPVISVEEKARQCAVIMDRFRPGMSEQVVALGEEGIRANLFGTRPILSQVLNDPSLPEFIKKLIEVVQQAPILSPGNPAAPPA
jgi:hypothetical protein